MEMSTYATSNKPKKKPVSSKNISAAKKPAKKVNSSSHIKAKINKPRTKASSSSLKYIVIVLICVVIIIGSIAFYAYRSKKSDDEQTLLERNNSDESNGSNIIESESDFSIDHDEQANSVHEIPVTSSLSETPTKRMTGRMISQLDPDLI
ncbi:hypothetical protein I4U23_008058 [Adineta vaga]|nr:hypothetical protein I4U23_008058 [Adineta vaga]